jgi:hypothetical protein
MLRSGKVFCSVKSPKKVIFLRDHRVRCGWAAPYHPNPGRASGDERAPNGLARRWRSGFGFDVARRSRSGFGFHVARRPGHDGVPDRGCDPTVSALRVRIPRCPSLALRVRMRFGPPLAWRVRMALLGSLTVGRDRMVSRIAARFETPVPADRAATEYQSPSHSDTSMAARACFGANSDRRWLPCPSLRANDCRRCRVHFLTATKVVPDAGRA